MIKQRTLTNGNAVTFMALVLVVIQLAASGVHGAMRRGQEQLPSAQASPPNSQPVAPMTGTDYRIGVGDTIEVRVDKAPELSGSFRVTSDGTFEMYFLGRVNAQNKTPEELSTLIADGLRGRYLKTPRVAVDVKQYNTHPVFVQGAVRSPGTYVLRRRVSLLKLISLCGGLTDNHGSTAFIFRAAHPKAPEIGKSNANASAASDGPSSDDGENGDSPDYSFTSVNITGLLRGNLDENVMIEFQDIVHIPPADVFFVAGEVHAPGSFPLKAGTTLRQAISLAQGTTIQAATNRAMIFREDTSTGKRVDVKVDVGAVMEGKSEDLAIRANDVIIIPNSKLKSVGAVLLRSVGGLVTQPPIRRF